MARWHTSIRFLIRWVTIWLLIADAVSASAQLSITPGDVNEDGIVNGLDIAAVASDWEQGWSMGDANHDDVVNGQDIALIASNWLKTGPTQAQVIDSIPAPPASAYTSGYNATSLQQIGLTQSVAAAANYGEGVTIGIVDTGVQIGDPGLAGRISPLSTCAPYCPAGYSINDQSGHGSIVTDVAASANPLQIGVAPKASIDVIAGDYVGSQGIRIAADSGAVVINVSLNGVLNNPGNVDSINYAASKGAVIVIAAGNNNQAYFDYPGQLGSPPGTVGGRYGFTEQALSHIIVVGGVNPTNTKESYSNIPGSDFIGTTGTQTWYAIEPDGTYVPYDDNASNVNDLILLPKIAVNNSTGPIATLQSIWLMAPAEIPNEGSGTSFAAPSVTGAIALLDSRWPILFKNGTTAQVLFDTATDLGAPGVDPIYGNGLLNLTAAFAPIGTLSTHGANGVDFTITRMGSYVQSGGALGSMSNMALALGSFTVFDSFQRDFQMNLSGMISARSSAASAVQAVTAPAPKMSGTQFTDGSSLSFGSQDQVTTGVDHPVGAAASNWFVSFSDASGASVAAGYGFPASASFAETLWGADSAASSQSASLGIANSLASIAQGGMFTAFGNQLGKATRVAFAWSQTQASDPILGTSWTAPNASAMNVGISTHLTDAWQMGVTLGSLGEQGGLLGTTYDTNGPLNLGNQNKSMSVGLSSAVKLTDKTDLLMEASVAKTGGATGAGFIESVSPLYARSYGVSLAEYDAFDAGDRLELTVKAPLAVFKGSAALAVTSVDGDGNATTTAQNVSLKPNGSELDLGVAYHAPTHDSFEWNASLTARHDADNVAGSNDFIGLVSAKFLF